MSHPAGFHEIVPDQTHIVSWKNVIIDTGSSQSTLQDIKVPSYGGGYTYRATSVATSNRYIFWRVNDDIVELWEECMGINLTHSHIHLRIVGLPILEGISVHEVDNQVNILVATIASVHCFRLPHPDSINVLKSSSGSLTCPSILRDVDTQNLREVHSMHLLASAAVEGGRVQAASSLVSDASAVFVYGQPQSSLMVLKMNTDNRRTVPLNPVSGSVPCYPAEVTLIKNNSLVNRFFSSFGMFRGGDRGDLVNSLCCLRLSSDGSGDSAYSLGISSDGRIRVWCLSRSECVLIRDSLEDTAEGSTRKTITGERHVLVSRELADGSALIAVRLSFVEKQLLLVYKVHLGAHATEEGAYLPVITHIRTLYPPQFRLVSLDLTSTHIWSMWTDANNDTQVLYCPLKDDNASNGFSHAILQEGPDKNIPQADVSMDPREVYLAHLFAPYSFSHHTISKALSICKGTSMDSSAPPFKSLKEEVEAVLQAQVEAKVSGLTTDDEVYDVTFDVWQNFYSHALQYHQVGCKGVSVVCGADGAVALIRQKAVTYLSAVDALEAILSTARQGTVSNLTQLVLQRGLHPILRGDTSVGSSVAGVIKCVTLIHSLITPELAAAFMLDMAHHNHPEEVAEDVASSLLAQVVNGDQVAGTLSSSVSSVPNFVTGLNVLVRALNFDTSDNLNQEMEQERGSKEPTGRGSLWCSLVSSSLHSLALERLKLCRDLLILQQATLQLAQLCHLSADAAGQLRANTVQETVLLTRAYHALLCLTVAPVTAPSQPHLASVRKMVGALALHDSTPALTPFNASNPPSTALSAILQQGACDLLHGDTTLWVHGALDTVSVITLVAWPLQNRSGSTLLLESLVLSGQSEAALLYIRQVYGWCEWSPCSRDFLLGLCLLLQGQYRKASVVLQEAGEGCTTEELLGERVGGGGETSRLNYTLRLVRLFEVFQQPGLAIKLATGALSIGQRWPSQLSQLYAVLFKHHLSLGHHDEAFTALLSNPDTSSQKACLRQLLVTLHNRGCLKTLVNYQFGSLSNDVVTILENRARSADILQNNYYHLLYAFHTHKMNYKKAASVMYECALRLAAEGGGEKALKEQLKCYLACINVLKLLPEDMAWILKPKPSHSPDDSSPTRNPKRTVLGERINRTAKDSQVVERQRRSKGGVEVLQLTTIDREYQLLHAKLTLSQHTASTGGDAVSTVAMLCHAKLYREALRVCHLFSVSVCQVFESLASACILADNSQEKHTHQAWLKLNHQETGNWWDLLRELLRQESESCELLKRVTLTLLEQSHSLPPWLASIYTRKDYGALLGLLLRFGHLESAGSITLRLLDAFITGSNCEQFGISGAVHITSDPVWLPYTAIDLLIGELRENKQHMFYDKMLTQLEGKLTQFQTETLRASKDRELLRQRW